MGTSAEFTSGKPLVQFNSGTISVPIFIYLKSTSCPLLVHFWSTSVSLPVLFGLTSSPLTFYSGSFLVYFLSTSCLPSCPRLVYCWFTSCLRSSEANWISRECALEILFENSSEFVAWTGSVTSVLLSIELSCLWLNRDRYGLIIYIIKALVNC